MQIYLKQDEKKADFIIFYWNVFFKKSLTSDTNLLNLMKAVPHSFPDQ